MSAAAHDAGSSESSSGYEDGLGRRVLAIDRESGEMRERLRLRPELTAFARALEERLPIVAALEDERFARPRLIVPEPDGRLSVLSDFVPGRRLCDILDVAGDHGIVAGLDAGLGLLLELLPALSRLHDAGIAHGAIGPGRIMVTTDGKVVLTDAIYAEALERLQLTRRRLWSEFRLAFPSTAGSPRFDKAADLTQAGLTAAALILGRPLRSDEYPDGLPDLRQEISEIASIRASKAFADGLDRFFGGTLPLAARKTALASADEAAIDIRKLLRKEVGITTCRAAMIDFFQQVDAAERERAEESTVEFARLEAQRIEVERFEADARARVREETDRRAREEAREEAERLEREEAERLAREEAERQVREEAEQRARDEAERRAREEAERKAREEAERRKREEAERKAREEAERRAREEAERRLREEAERKAREEAERKAREEAERRKREEAERKAREEAERRAREEAERKAREEAERKAREEAERRKREEAERKAREEAERKAREEAERKAREEAERRAREEAERKAREEAERRAREEAERRAREEAERKAREEAERKAREEAERKAREEAERKAREAAERKAREEAERKAREEAERKAREEAERRIREEAERKAREAAERKAREEAERKAREEAERRAREEAERQAREEAVRREREEAERKAREEAERKAREIAERKAREEAERIERARLEAERAERERIEAEHRERERAEQETRDRIERARQEAERTERDRIERERAERERSDRRQAEWRERDRVETERRERERADREARERDERDRVAGAAPAGGWLIPPDRAAAFEPIVSDEPPPQPVPHASAYPIYAPSAETQSWTPELEPPPAIEIAPVAAPTPQHSTIKLQEPKPSKGIRLKDEPSGVTQAPSPRAASRHEPLSLSAAGAYEPFSAKEETREIPWKLIAAGLVIIAGAFGILKGYPSSSDNPKPPATKAPAAQPTPAPAPAPPPVAANQTRVTVTSDPAGLRVTIDGKAVGATPLTLDKITPGKHVMTLQGAGGTMKKNITVVQGQTLAVDVPVFSGFAELSVPFVAEVSENGKLLGTSDSQIILGPGRHLLHLQNKDLNYNSVQTVDIEPGESTRVTVDPRGSANINAVPWAEVFIDGQKAGETPLANVSIRLGVREVILRNPQFPERRIVTTVKSGVPVTIAIDFNKDR